MKQLLRKLIALNLVPILLIGMLAMPVHAETSAAIASGYCGGEGDGTNLSWTLTEDGTLTISGEGKMADYSSSDSLPWNNYRSDTKSVVINDGVTTIGNNAFWNCTSLTEVTIPDTATSIGDYVFDYCRSLTEVTIPNSVQTIGRAAFQDCNTLSEVTVPDSVTSISEWAFNGCTALTEVTIPNSVQTIGSSAFLQCSSLTAIHVDENNHNYSSDIFGVLFNKDKTMLIQAPGAIAGTYTIPGSVTSIGNHAFSGAALTEVTIPNSVTSIGSHAFSYCRALKEVTIPGSVTSIGDWTFAVCNSLTEVTIPNSVTSIGNFAFSNCNLTKVPIPRSVTSIGLKAFYNCNSLTAIHVDENNPYYSSDSFGALFNKDKTILIQVPSAIVGTYTIPNSVISIGDNAFWNCASLTEVIIGNSVTSIGNHAFSYCSALSELTIPDSVTSIGVWAFAASHSNLEVIRFTGDAPTGNRIFASVTATAYYPGWNETWTPEVMQNYVADTSPFGGKITWVPFDTAAILCDTCTETETAVTVLYDPDAAETVTGYIALYDKEGGFLRLETVTEQSNAEGTIDLSISYTEEEYAGIGRIAAFVVNGETMEPLCDRWDTPVNTAAS